MYTNTSVSLSVLFYFDFKDCQLSKVIQNKLHFSVFKWFLCDHECDLVTIISAQIIEVVTGHFRMDQ